MANFACAGVYSFFKKDADPGETSSQAYTLLYNSSNNLTVTGWQTRSVTFGLDTGLANYLSDVNAAIGAAQGLWNGVPSSDLSLSIGSTVTLQGGISTYLNAGTVIASAPQGNPVIYCDTNFGRTRA